MRRTLEQRYERRSQRPPCLKIRTTLKNLYTEDAPPVKTAFRVHESLGPLCDKNQLQTTKQ